MDKWKEFDEFYSHILKEVYHEPDSFLTTQVVDKMLPGFLDIVKNKEAHILDLGCGSGYALEKMREAGFNNVEGLTLSDIDKGIVEEKGFKVNQVDFNFTCWVDEWDAVWMRHVLEHSPFPFFTIYQLNKMMKLNGFLYVEMPQPGTERVLEHWPNHYSIMGSAMYKSLFERAGFNLVATDFIGMNLEMKEGGTVSENYDWYLLQKVQEIKIE
jgi:2-polyprenyl-3-methyl-5-hydroxy-6-metoxy-1,4-benzoquinol methylase